MKEGVEWYSSDFQKKLPDTYNEGDYKVRNEIFAEIISKLNPKGVFEFAGKSERT